MSELKPCPFCGRPANVRQSQAKCSADEYGKTVFKITYRIGCPNCSISFSYESVFNFNNEGKIHYIQDGYQIAAEKWNKRIGE